MRAPQAGISMRPAALVAPIDQPRPYQRTARRNVERALAKHRRVLLVEFMGTGKTVIAAMFVRSWIGAGGRVLVLVHRGEILKQTLAKLTRAGIPAENVGIIWAQHRGMNLDAPVQLATVQTLARREDARSRAIWAAKSAEERSEIARKRWESMTPEQQRKFLGAGGVRGPRKPGDRQ